MVLVYSYLNDEKDVIESIVGSFDQDIQQKLINKIVASIELFCQNMNLDGKNSKNATGPICYFLISVPNSKELLRIFFAYQKGEFVLLTSYLVKPKHYSKKQEIKKVEKDYDKQISFSKKIYDDFISKTYKYDYYDITDRFKS
ncbi:hypothetical protein [Candidatus Absconditicoccus praedator]|uniref:hypothetical protein n=1 Tax=Candidatus Absconditicoccus praedator TaxID=2735562 RepID=UPI001E622170|nr:hypothetical protein [Candidatus Absconditicoccus praedator]UFX83386.1 hypothetical protein HLG78_04630 [Candidatus Absconditicoccus praedator]